MIKRRFWSLKKGQSFWRGKTLCRKFDCVDWYYDDFPDDLFGILPWTKVWCEPPVDNPVTRIGDGWGPFVDAMEKAEFKHKVRESYREWHGHEMGEVKLVEKPTDVTAFRASIAGIHAMSNMEQPDMLGYRSAMLSIRGECEHLIPELVNIRTKD